MYIYTTPTFSTSSVATPTSPNLHLSTPTPTPASTSPTPTSSVSTPETYSAVYICLDYLHVHLPHICIFCACIIFNTSIYTDACITYTYTCTYLYIIYICISTSTHIYIICQSVQFSRSVVSNSLRPHELQHARPLCPSPHHVYPRLYHLHPYLHTPVSTLSMGTLKSLSPKPAPHLHIKYLNLHHLYACTCIKCLYLHCLYVHA